MLKLPAEVEPKREGTLYNTYWNLNKSRIDLFVESIETKFTNRLFDSETENSQKESTEDYLQSWAYLK